jgi:hypothetical protein
MPFDPTKPAENAPNSSAEMRGQLNALNDDIQTRATSAALASNVANLLAITSNTSNSVAKLSQAADSSYNQTQMQDVLNKLDELLDALRR